MGLREQLEMESSKKLDTASPIKQIARQDVDGLEMLEAPADHSDQTNSDTSVGTKFKNFVTKTVAKLIKKNKEKRKRRSKR